MGGIGGDGGDGSWLSIFHESPTPQGFFASRIEALVGAISDFATRSRKWLPLPLHSQMPVEQQESSPGNFFDPTWMVEWCKGGDRNWDQCQLCT